MIDDQPKLRECNTSEELFKLPKVIDTTLWPNAIKLSCDIDNSTVCDKFSNSRIKDYAIVDIRPVVRHNGMHKHSVPLYSVYIL
jgi:hypothetical protein